MHPNNKRLDFVNSYWLGLTSYEKCLSLVREVVHPSIKNSSKVVILYSVHYPVLTLGKKIKMNNLTDNELSFWKKNKVNVIETDRGGELTYHDQGQLMIYPVMSLKNYKLSVKRFVEICYKSTIKMLEIFGIKSEFDLSCPGVWVNIESERKKIISSGFRIRHGLSEHGLALYLRNVPEEFSYFSPCGMSHNNFISLSDLTGVQLSISDVLNIIDTKLRTEFSNELKKFLTTHQ